jgi:hypothetical protein
MILVSGSDDQATRSCAVTLSHDAHASFSRSKWPQIGQMKSSISRAFQAGVWKFDACRLRRW